MRTLLMPLPDFQREAFVGTAPSRETLKRWVQTGELPGKKIGGKWFVLLDENGELVTQQQSPTGNPDADAILRDWQATA